jgi:hypothetical protein
MAVLDMFVSLDRKDPAYWSAFVLNSATLIVRLFNGNVDLMSVLIMSGGSWRCLQLSKTGVK